MKNQYSYINRDISWLSFNHRVLEEAKDETVSIKDRLRFVGIYWSNLDEFYGVRVSMYRNAVVKHKKMRDVSNPAKTLSTINSIVSNHMLEMSTILRDMLIPELKRSGVNFHIDQPADDDFSRKYFLRVIIPYLQPVFITKRTRVFLRNNRPYFALKMYSKGGHRPVYALVMLPLRDLARFVELPRDEQRHIVFLDDIIRANIGELFPGYDIVGMWLIKALRDADIDVDDASDIVFQLKENLSLRQTGVVASLYHDRDIAPDLLRCLKQTFGFSVRELVETGRYLSLKHLYDFPIENTTPQKPVIEALMHNNELLVHYPYHKFDHVINALKKASRDKHVEDIKITLYRLAKDSKIVDALIDCARNGKNVTAFVELKARFDEENNLTVSEKMKQAGIRVIYSIPHLKVHAKLLLIDRSKRSVAYLSTGNFNECTARQYTDHALFTCNKDIVDDVRNIFLGLEQQRAVGDCKKILVTKYNMQERLIEMIDEQIKSNNGYILLKMNGLQNRLLINKLYEASRAGVKIDLIIRGICCLVPDEEYSKNIRIKRIVDGYLEHGRVYVFGRQNPKVYISSADWLNRNIERRIEVAFPIENHTYRNELLDILALQMRDEHQGEIFHSQQHIYEYLSHKKDVEELLNRYK